MALPRRVARAMLTALFAGAVAWPRPGISKDVIQPGANQPIKIKSESILFDRDKPRKTRFGKLEWLGTLMLNSPSPYFGGYSGLVLDKTGTRLLAISDKGLWLGARLTYRAGKMEKLSESKVGILRGIDNNPLSRKFIADAESMVMEQPGCVTGTAYVSFERKHRIAVYPVTKNGFGTPRRHLALPARAKSVDPNKGIEGIAAAHAHADQHRNVPLQNRTNDSAETAPLGFLWAEFVENEQIECICAPLLDRGDGLRDRAGVQPASSGAAAKRLRDADRGAIWQHAQMHVASMCVS